MVDEIANFSVGDAQRIARVVSAYERNPLLSTVKRRMHVPTFDDVTSDSGGGGGGGSGCGCCDCFNCITPSQATVGDCTSAPNGAAYFYTINLGEWASFPLFTQDGLITLTYGVSGENCDITSSSSSWTSGGSCVWTSCIFEICEDDEVTSESSSSSSSGSPRCGTYQWWGTIYTDVNGNPAWDSCPVLLDGEDWLGIAETL